MPKATTSELYDLLEVVAKTIFIDMQSDDQKVQLAARSNEIKLLKNNQIKADPNQNESLRSLAEDFKKSTEWANLKEVPLFEES